MEARITPRTAVRPKQRHNKTTPGALPALGWAGKECRWIEANDGSPREGPPNATNGNGIPACFNTSVGGTPHLQAVDNNVPGSYDPKTGKNFSHPMGGSHWYFPPAYQLNTYNKYYLMSGTWERAGTVGFRCVADAEDDCGTDGKLCASEATPPPTAEFHSTLKDWAVFGTPAGAVTKAGAHAIGAVESAGQHVIEVEAATAISWAGGAAGHASGQSTRARAYTGAGAGFKVTAAAPTAGKKARLSLYVGGLLRAHGTAIATVNGATQNVSVTSDASVVSFVYEGGPLAVDYRATEGTVCADDGLCVLPLVHAKTHFACTSACDSAADQAIILSKPACERAFTPSSSGEQVSSRCV